MLRRWITGAVLSVLILGIGSACADVTLVRKDGVLFVEEFDNVNTGTDRGKAWSVGDPPVVEMKGVDGVAVLREVGSKSYAKTQRYLPFDLTEPGYPYLHIEMGEGKGPMSFANQSTGGQNFPFRVKGPGLYTVDRRQTRRLPQLKKGRFAFTVYVFGPKGDKPGPESRLERIRAVSSPANHIVAELLDKQAEDQPGHGVASVGDVIKLKLELSEPADAVSFGFEQCRTNKPIKLSGKTAFEADKQQGGAVWTVELPLDETSDRSFKTVVEKADGTSAAGLGRVNVVAEVTGGPYKRIIGYVPFGFDRRAK